MLKQIKHLILDMDGVLWTGNTPVPGLAEFFTTLDQLAIGYVLATNNASKTAVQYTQKLAHFGVTVTPDHILTSALATASYLSERYAAGTAVYIIGGLGLHEAMAEKGFRSITPEQVGAGEQAALVVVGLHPDVTYKELAAGSLLVHKGATFIGTNADATFPSELGPLPGAGALQGLIITATGVQPIIVGKPGPIMFAEAVKRLGSAPPTTAMVGDRLETDIKGGQAAGLQTVLVLTGISSRAEVEQGPIKPDYIFADITALADYLANRG